MEVATLDGITWKGLKELSIDKVCCNCDHCWSYKNACFCHYFDEAAKPMQTCKMFEERRALNELT